MFYSRPYRRKVVLAADRRPPAVQNKPFGQCALLWQSGLVRLHTTPVRHDIQHGTRLHCIGDHQSLHLIWPTAMARSVDLTSTDMRNELLARIAKRIRHQPMEKDVAAARPPNNPVLDDAYLWNRAIEHRLASQHDKSNVTSYLR
ncbi:hypothetical protein [Paracoccus sp. Ld10]|uniref:hypothetical protein n=1 Tax=Paracoccus sp. Ld10 TaxID=649158 RepID=UPI00386D460B